MHKSYLAYLLTVVMSLFIYAGAKADNSPLLANETLLARLDSIISGHESLVKEKENRITGLRDSLAHATDAELRLGLTRRLYDEYLVFDSDSALHYATLARHLTERLHPSDYDGIAYWKLNEAFIHTVQGLHDTALHLLRTIDSTRLSPEMRSSYFGGLSYLHSMRAVYVQQNHDMWETDTEKANAYRDSIQALHLPPAEEWLWVPVATVIEEGREDIRSVDVTRLKESVDNTRTPSRRAAINAYWMSRYYEALGDEEDMLRYKTMAAIYDAQIVNREIVALQEIAAYLFEKGELDRAYGYLAFTAGQENLYHNRFRMATLSDILPTVRDAYRQEIERRDTRIHGLFVAIAVLSGLLLCAAILIIFLLRRLGKERGLRAESRPDKPGTL